MPSAQGLATLLLTLTRWLQKTTFTRSELARHQGGSCSSGLLPAWVRPTRSLETPLITGFPPHFQPTGLLEFDHLNPFRWIRDSWIREWKTKSVSSQRSPMYFIQPILSVGTKSLIRCNFIVHELLEFSEMLLVETKDSQDTEVGEMVNTEIRCRGAH